MPLFLGRPALLRTPPITTSLSETHIFENKPSFGQFRATGKPRRPTSPRTNVLLRGPEVRNIGFWRGFGGSRTPIWSISPGLTGIRKSRGPPDVGHRRARPPIDFPPLCGSSQFLKGPETGARRCIAMPPKVGQRWKWGYFGGIRGVFRV